jgi:hypothetical protein
VGFPIVVEVVTGTEAVEKGHDYVAIGLQPPPAGDGQIPLYGTRFVLVNRDGSFAEVPIECCVFQGFIAAPIDDRTEAAAGLVVAHDRGQILRTEG